MTLREAEVDSALLERFNKELGGRVPRLEASGAGWTVLNATPLVDMTDDVIECGRTQYGIDVSEKRPQVFGKLESKILGGSIKVRPAVKIVENGILSGRLRSDTTIFEATSGNFGIALGLTRRLGLNVVALVSRKLQEGVLKELEGSGVKLVNLDVDVCPAPGAVTDVGLMMGKAAASSVRFQLDGLGFDAEKLVGHQREMEELLGASDAIGLAKLLAKVYDGFCPEQYDSELNPEAHETVTGPELDQQLGKLSTSLGEFAVVCAFGTGGTSFGLSDYLMERYGTKSVRVVFPLEGQDVAGIRTRSKAAGLRFYRPEKFAAQHDVDFEPSKKALAFFAKRGYDIGESSALAIYATLQMLNYGTGNKFVVILADGIQKYAGSLTQQRAPGSLEVSLEEAREEAGQFGTVIWTHPVFRPTATGLELIASSLGIAKEEIHVASKHDVETLAVSKKLSEGLGSLIPKDGRAALLVCMRGNTSLMLAQLLSGTNVGAVSLKGGILGIPSVSGTVPTALIEPLD